MNFFVNLPQAFGIGGIPALGELEQSEQGDTDAADGQKPHEETDLAGGADFVNNNHIDSDTFKQIDDHPDRK